MSNYTYSGAEVTLNFSQTEYFEGDTVDFSAFVANAILLDRAFEVNVTVELGTYTQDYI